MSSSVATCDIHIGILGLHISCVLRASSKSDVCIQLVDSEELRAANRQ